jgi:CMP-N-acetylneuraminic acid synthetase
MKIVALVPARCGSKRIESKNLQLIGGTSIVERKVGQLRQAKLIHEVYVGSDGKAILDAGVRAGAIPVMRDPVACDEAVSPANVMIADFVKRVEADVIVWAHCTNPFIYGEQYDAAIERFLANENQGYDSLLSVTKIQSHMWNHHGFPCNYNPYGPRHTLARELEPVYFQDGGIFIQHAADFRRNSYFFGRRPFLYQLDAMTGFDINTPDELEMARLIQPLMDSRAGFAGSDMSARNRAA